MSKYPIKIEGVDYQVEITSQDKDGVDCLLTHPGLDLTVLRAYISEKVVSIRRVTPKLDTGKVLFLEQFLVQLAELHVDGTRPFEGICSLNRDYKASLNLDLYQGPGSYDYPAGGNLR